MKPGHDIWLADASHRVSGTADGTSRLLADGVSQTHFRKAYNSDSIHQLTNLVCSVLGRGGQNVAVNVHSGSNVFVA